LKKHLTIIRSASFIVAIVGVIGILSSIPQINNPLLGGHRFFLNIIFSILNINPSFSTYFKILYYFAFLITGYFIFKLHPVSSYLVIFLNGISLFALFYIWGTVGLVEHNLFYYISLLIIIITIAVVEKYYLSQYIRCSKKLKILRNIIFMLFSITLLIYIISIMMINKDSPSFTESNFSYTSYADELDIVTFDFPNYSIDFPIDDIRIFYLLDFDYPTITFKIPKDSLYIILQRNSSIHGIYNELHKNSVVNEYDFINRLLNEKFGLTYLSINDKLFNISKITTYKQFNVNSLITIASLKSSNCGEYSLFQDIEIGNISFVNLKKDETLKITDSTNVVLTINNLISSLKPINETLYSDDDYHQQGLDLYNKGKYKRSSLKFISSLLKNNDNSNCKVYLVKSIINSEDFVDQGEGLKWIIAENLLEDIVKQDPKNTEAQSLYQKACDFNDRN
jgi:hypothetical protein